MSPRALLILAVAVAAVLLVTDLLQLWWVGRRANPDHGPRDRTRWERATAAELAPGDVVLSAALSPNPETVVAVDAHDPDRISLVFRSGRTARARPDQPVRRHRAAP